MPYLKDFAKQLIEKTGYRVLHKNHKELRQAAADRAALQKIEAEENAAPLLSLVVPTYSPPQATRVRKDEESRSNVRRVLNMLRRFIRLTGSALRLASAGINNPALFRVAWDRLQNRRRRIHEGLSNAKARVDTAVIPRLKGPEFDDVLASLSQTIPVLEIERTQTKLTLGIADVDLITAALHLVCAIDDLALDKLSTRIDPESRRGAMAIMAAGKVSGQYPDKNGEPLILSLEGFEARENGKWISRNDRNRIMRAVYHDVFSTPGLTTSVQILGAPTLKMQAEGKPVDIVYTWVNHEDSEWKKLFADHAHESTNAPAHQPLSADAAAIARFRNNEELRYSLRSVLKNIPWFNRIHVFSNCAPPEWFTPNDDRLVWVRHEDVIPGPYLPTFNSHVIESYLHHLPGLSDQFIYCNDDVFIMKPLQKGNFFTPAGHSRCWLEGYGMVSGEAASGDPDYLNASRNSAALLKQEFGFAPTRLHSHVPFALLRPLMQEIEERFAERFTAFRPNRFRRSNDLNLPSFLYHHYAISQGWAVESVHNSVMVRSSDLRWGKRLAQAKSGKYVFACINEGGTIEPTGDWHRHIQTFMKQTFPRKAPWER